MIVEGYLQSIMILLSTLRRPYQTRWVTKSVGELVQGINRGLGACGQRVYQPEPGVNTPLLDRKLHRPVDYTSFSFQKRHSHELLGKDSIATEEARRNAHSFMRRVRQGLARPDEKIECAQCKVVEDSSAKKRHFFSPIAQQILCVKCYWRKKVEGSSRICSNPTCNTAEKEQPRPFWHGRGGWSSAGQLLCERCYTYARHNNGQLPSRRQIQRKRGSRIHSPVLCWNDSCRQSETEASSHFRRGREGWTSAGQLLCERCFSCAKRNNGQLPPTLEIHRSKGARIHSPRTCWNDTCRLSETMTSTPFRYGREGWTSAGQLLCYRCFRYAQRKNGQLPSTSRVIRRGNGAKKLSPATCWNNICCLPESETSRSFRRGREGWSSYGQLLCRTCFNYAVRTNGLLPTVPWRELTRALGVK